MHANEQNELASLLIKAKEQGTKVIFLTSEVVTGGTYPTTWASAYVIINNFPFRLTSKEHMKKRRRDDCFYWHVNGYGTSHRYLIKESIFHAAGLQHMMSEFSIREL